ncbi:hypothetical protein, partial [Bradyrhizobium liaoningense]|uniref:hypothetical protein n=1 Tax=Bradyrhizobium liaoningense TaxID=43992 RepID=UPI0024E18077
RLKHLAIFPRKVDFSCFGYHPDLESRLTFQEKWVLAWAREQCRPATLLRHWNNCRSGVAGLSLAGHGASL